MTKFRVLQSPLDKGESWKKKNSREIEIKQSGDNRGCKPTVYFGIFKDLVKGQKIVEDFFLPVETAIDIAKAILDTAHSIQNEFDSKKKKPVKLKSRKINI